MPPKILTNVNPMVKARTELVMSEPFYGVLALRMKLREDPTCDTAWCDGVTIGYNMKYVLSLTGEERRGLLVHELMHPALLHHTRRGNRHHKKWNVACDYALNPLISKRYKLPDGALENPQYTNMSAEQIYTMLPECDWDKEDSDPGGCGEVRDTPNDGKQAQDALNKQAESEWRQAVASARHAAKMAGRMPAYLEKILDTALEPKIEWKYPLRRFISEKARDEESWNKANRRFISEGLYLPARDSERIGPIAIIRDTSGSIYGTPEALQQFNGEIESIALDVQPSKIYVIDCDAAVQRVIEADVGDELPGALTDAKGGGGTDFRPPFKWLEENDIEPKCVIYLTDGWGTYPDERDVQWPVMWAMITDENPPFGEVVRIE
jgi:predicted metal-dependent peptidase